MGRFINEYPIEFAGGDNNFYIYVKNNPMNWIDPFGLTQEDVDRGKEVLKEFYPEYFNEDANVSFGDLPPELSGSTDIWTGDITIPNKFKEGLDDADKEKLLETLAHEYQHSNDSTLQRLLDSTIDTDNHNKIIENALNLSTAKERFAGSASQGHERALRRVRP